MKSTWDIVDENLIGISAFVEGGWEKSQEISLGEMAPTYTTYPSVWSCSRAPNQLWNCIWKTLNWYLYTLGVCAHGAKSYLYFYLTTSVGIWRHITTQKMCIAMLCILYLTQSMTTVCAFVSHYVHEFGRHFYLKNC